MVAYCVVITSLIFGKTSQQIRFSSICKNLNFKGHENTRLVDSRHKGSKHQTKVYVDANLWAVFVPISSIITLDQCMCTNVRWMLIKSTIHEHTIEQVNRRDGQDSISKRLQMLVFGFVCSCDIKLLCSMLKQ